MHLKYQTSIVWSEEDNCFIASVPELPGCTAHGDTRDAALREIQTAMELWVETASEAGDLIPQPALLRAD